MAQLSRGGGEPGLWPMAQLGRECPWTADQTRAAKTPAAAGSRMTSFPRGVFELVEVRAVLEHGGTTGAGAYGVTD